jgi:hypothetical protein
MAHEVTSGQTAALQQYELQIEHQKAAQAAQADRAKAMIHGADRQNAFLEGTEKSYKKALGSLKKVIVFDPSFIGAELLRGELEILLKFCRHLLYLYLP